MPDEEEEGEGGGEVEEELGVGGWHAVAFAVHFYKSNTSVSVSVDFLRSIGVGR